MDMLARLSAWIGPFQRTTATIEGISRNGPFKKTITANWGLLEMFTSLYGGGFGVEVRPGGIYINGRQAIDDNCDTISVESVTSSAGFNLRQAASLLALGVLGGGIGIIIGECGLVLKKWLQ